MRRTNLWIQKYFSTLPDRIFFLCGILMTCSEIWKQLTLTFVLGNGAYNWWYFPFQLCSIPVYILLVYPWLRGEKVRRMLLAFLMSFGLMGGIVVFFDQSGLRYPLPALTFHSYAWHIALIFIGISSGIVYCLKFASRRGRIQNAAGQRILFSRSLSRSFSLLPFLHAALLYLACCLCAEFLNLTFDSFGKINMFYINPDYPMQQIIFRDLPPVIGNLPAILVYIAAGMSGAFCLFLVWGLVFRLLIRR